MSNQDTRLLRGYVGHLCAEHRSIKSTNVTEINGVVIVRVNLKWWAGVFRGWMLKHFYSELTPTLSEGVVLEVL